MKVAVIQFPGSNCDRDAFRAVKGPLGLDCEFVWHKETSLQGFDAAILPGGFSYGDYLRCGAIARFSPVMEALVRFAGEGRSVLGICNGFQVLCESGLLPGALIQNNNMKFVCQDQPLEVEDSNGQFNTAKLGSRMIIPIAHGEGNYRIDDAGLENLRRNRQVLFRYTGPHGGGNPNGSLNNIAGVRNEMGNVYGMMPHPERVVEPFHPNLDGIKVLEAFFSIS
jgi:phosphoribosylformylglycinamidine synthase I